MDESRIGLLLAIMSLVVIFLSILAIWLFSDYKVVDFLNAMFIL